MGILGGEKSRHRESAKAAAKGISGIFPHLPKKILTAYPQILLFNTNFLLEVQIIGKNKLTY